MTTFEPFDIVVVPFPFSDLIHAKKRKAVILSSQSFQKSSGNVTLGMVTSADRSSWPGDVKLEDLNVTGLKKSCYFRCKFFSLDLNLILERSGYLSKKDAERVGASLRAHFGL